MAKKVASHTTPMNLVRISLGIFLTLLGIMGIVPNLDESVFSLNNSYSALEVMFGIVELICGVFIIMSMFTMFSRKIKYQVSLIILIFWLARIGISKILFGFTVNANGIFFYPNMAVWLLVLSCELIIAACLWMNYLYYRD